MIRKMSLYLCLCAGLFLCLPPGASLAQGAERQSADGVFTLDARIALNGFRGLVDAHLAGVMEGLKALAATQDVTSGDWERLRPALDQFSKAVPSDAAMWYAKPDGSYFVTEGSAAGQTLKDRDYFPDLMAGKDVNNRLVISKSTGLRSVIVATPVVKDGQVVGALGASISVEKLAKFVDDSLLLPKGVVFYALDAKGQTAVHRDVTLMFQFPSDIGDETLKASIRTMLAEPEGVERYRFRGVGKTVIFERSAATGWIFALGTTQGD